MLKNNNRSAVKKLSDRALRQNRTRNFFAILAIVLTTFMFTTVFSIGFSLAQNMNTMLLRQQGTKASIYLSQPSAGQKKQAEGAENLHAAGVQVPVASATDSTGEKDFRLNYYDRTEFEENLAPALSDIQGNYPRKRQELMLSLGGLEALGIREPEEGMEISLQSEKGELPFTLSGWFRDYTMSSGKFLGMVSENYMKSRGLSVERDGMLCLSSKMGKSGELLEELKKSVDLRQGQEFDSSYDVQNENSDTVLVMSLTLGLIGLVIMLSGYLLIYNVMYISVTRDIRFYGMLKTIGTSPSQIKQIVKLQIRRLSVLGIPLGILLGTSVAFLLVPIALQMYSGGSDGSMMPGDMSFHPLIYGGTILFAILTVAVSCRKPASLAGKVSVVEALKYHGKPVKAKSKKTTSGGKLYKMAFRNVFREKKRAFLVFASLFMGTMAFLMANTFLGSMKLDHYVEYYLPNDFTLYTYSEEEGEDEEREFERNVERLLADIRKLDGIRHMNANRSLDVELKLDEDVFAPFFEEFYGSKEEIEKAISFYNTAKDQEERFGAPTIIVDSEMIRRHNETAREKIDIERFEKGEICLLGSLNDKKEADLMKGKRITLLDDATGWKKELEVGACMTPGDDRAINIGYYWQKGGAPSAILISEKAAEGFAGERSVDNIIVDCDKGDEPYVRREIHKFIKDNPAVRHMEIKSEMMEDFKSAMSAMNVLSGGISLVLILIGVINFINVMLTGVYARRMELAVLESVGMTKKQVRRMLGLEGIYYGAVSILLILTLGNVMIYWIGNAARQIADYGVFYYPVLPILGIGLAIMGICIAVPALVYRNLSRESVTERLRSGE